MDQKNFLGKSHPINEQFYNFAMIGVEDVPSVGLKFARISSEHYKDGFTVILFMDNKATDLEIEEWQSFSSRYEDFKAMNVKVVGVCTDSHVAVRSFMLHHNLQGIKFPIISDREGTLSKSFGVLKTAEGKFGAARALAIMDSMKLVFLSVKNESTKSEPEKIMRYIKLLRGEIREELDIGNFVLKLKKKEQQEITETTQPKEEVEEAIKAEEAVKEVTAEEFNEIKKKEDIIMVTADVNRDEARMEMCNDCQYKDLPHSKYLHEIGKLWSDCDL